MNKKQLAILLALLLIPLSAMAITFDDMLGHHPSKSQPFMGEHKNIKWVSHTPDLLSKDPKEEKAAEEALMGPNSEADDRGQVDVGNTDLDGDGKDETIKAIWNAGVSDHALTIEVYKESKKIVTLQPKGIQPNFKVEDIDGDGKLEIALWGAVGDPKISQDISDESKPFEGHSSPHLFKVSIYKLEQGKYKLSKEYTSRRKYEPFCEEQPEE